jgi:hypothetical protein
MITGVQSYRFVVQFEHRLTLQEQHPFVPGLVVTCRLRLGAADNPFDPASGVRKQRLEVFASLYSRLVFEQVGLGFQDGCL